MLADLERAIAARDPSLGALFERYLAQDDPEPGHSEVEIDLEDRPEPDVPAGAYTLDRLRRAVSDDGLAGKTATEQKISRVDAFALAEASRFAPPRLRVGKLLLALYERGEPGDRAALLHVFASAKLAWGAWQGAKSIYKLAETRFDAAMFGVLAYRFDAMTSTEYADIGTGTLVYLKRRSWRFLRRLGTALPDAYTTFAAEVLRHYPDGYSGESWVAAHVVDHGNADDARYGWTFEPEEFDARAFPDAWKAAPEPLLHLLEVAHDGFACNFAIQLLRMEHALALRAVEPAWLARLGRRPIAAVQGFVVRLLQESPQLHQSRLRELGLHDMVVGLLRSSSSEARAYALQYCAAHAPEIAIDELVALLAAEDAAVRKFASARLKAMKPAQLGLVTLVHLLGESAAQWAPSKLAQGFSPRDVGVELFVDTGARGETPFTALVEWFDDKRVPVPAAYYTALLDDSRFAGGEPSEVIDAAWEALGKRPAREIGVAWIQRSFERRERSERVAPWLTEGKLAGAELDVEWLEGLVRVPRLRATALEVLGNRRLVEPPRLGLAWVLDLARSSDDDLRGFARRVLLEGFTPDDLGGVAKLWQLATGKSDSVRATTALYLTAHHPDLGPRLDEARTLGVEPRLGHEAYAMATVRPLLADQRVDVRRLALAITGEELVRWGDPDVVFELAGSVHPDVRALGSELLLGTISDASDARRVPETWLDGQRLFRLAESPHKPARDVALTLIRKLYDRVGGAERLAWLMDSTDREVRLFAVRLFWDRHRPRPWPTGWAPKKQRAGLVGVEPFADLAALRQFTRVVVFGLPPGRVAPGDASELRPERALQGSVAKRRLIEAMRDLALEDVDLARAISPLFGEMTSSIAKGEWQACVQALAALRARHGDLPS